MTLHQVDYALKYCQQLVALREGEVFYQGAAADIGEQALAALYTKAPTTDTMPAPVTRPLRPTPAFASRSIQGQLS